MVAEYLILAITVCALVLILENQNEIAIGECIDNLIAGGGVVSQYRNGYVMRPSVAVCAHIQIGCQSSERGITQLCHLVGFLTSFQHQRLNDVVVRAINHAVGKVHIFTVDDKPVSLHATHRHHIAIKGDVRRNKSLA